MELDEALKIMFDAQAKLRTSPGISEPTLISYQMQRLAQSTGAAEERLAKYEEEYEVKQGMLYKQYLLDEKLPATQAEKRVKIELAHVKSQIVYLTRLTSSAWKQVGVCQSRINHLTKENSGQI